MFKGLVMALAVCVLTTNGIQDARAAAAGGGVAGGPPVAGTPVAPWALMACPALIVIAAFLNHHRELTAAEAWTCGLSALFPWQPPIEAPLRVKG